MDTYTIIRDMAQSWFIHNDLHNEVRDLTSCDLFRKIQKVVYDLNWCGLFSGRNLDVDQELHLVLDLFEHYRRLF